MNESREGITLGVIYILSPGFLTTFCHLSMFGKTDVIVLGLYLLCLAAALWDKNLFLIPVFALAAALTHDQFMFEYFPFLFLVLCYLAYVEKKEVYKRYVWMTTGICSAVSFWMRFFGHMNVTKEELVQLTQARTDMEMKAEVLEYQYYKSIKEILGFVKDVAVQNNNFLYILTAVIVGFPLIYFLYSILHLFAQQSGTKEERILACLFKLSPILPVISCMVAVDWGRYILAYYNAVYFMILFGVQKGNAKMCAGVRQTNEKIRIWFGEYWLLLMVVYFMICGQASFGAGTLYDKFNPCFYRWLQWAESGLRRILCLG